MDNLVCFPKGQDSEQRFPLHCRTKHQNPYGTCTFPTLSSAQVNDTSAPDQSHQNPDRGLDENPEAEVTVKTSENSIYNSAKTFEELNLHPDLLKGESFAACRI